MPRRGPSAAGVPRWPQAPCGRGFGADAGVERMRDLAGYQVRASETRRCRCDRTHQRRPHPQEAVRTCGQRLLVGRHGAHDIATADDAHDPAVGVDHRDARHIAVDDEGGHVLDGGVGADRARIAIHDVHDHGRERLTQLVGIAVRRPGQGQVGAEQLDGRGRMQARLRDAQAGFGIAGLRTQLLVLAAISAVVWISESVFEYLFQVQWRNLAQTVQHDLRVDAYAHVQQLEQAYFEDRSTGGLLSVLNDDVNQLERFLDRGANEILQVLTTVLIIGVAFFVIAPGIAVFAVAPIPIVLWGSFRFQRLLEPRYAAVRDQVGVLNSALANNLSGIATIKAFTAEQREIARIGADSQVYRERNGEAIRLSSMFVPLIRMAILVAFSFILVMGGMRALDGTLAVGVYSVMIFIVQRLLWPLTRLGETFDLYQRAMASTRRILDLLATHVGITGGTRPMRRPVRGELTFDDVVFAYDDGGVVLSGLDLKMPPEQTTAIVGATGAGKSTIVKLLLRLYDPTSGAVRSVSYTHLTLPTIYAV